MRRSRKKVIRENCIDCMGKQPRLVKKCHLYNCPLWPFRMGKEEKIIPKMIIEKPSLDIQEKYYRLNQ